ncbi:hypothetical protein Tco_1391111 [Tanacetum coccineum]
MYPRFIQILLNKHQRLLLPHKRTYVSPTLIQKLFSNMRRVSKGFTGVNIPLFSSMLVQGPIQVPTPPHDSPIPGGHTPGSDEDGAEIQGRPSVDTEILLDQEEPTELVEDLGSGEKGEKEISTASATPEVSTVAENLVYLRRSAKKRIDKGKATMKEDEYVQKKAKKQLEQERLRHEEAIRLQEQINEEER